MSSLADISFPRWAELKHHIQASLDEFPTGETMADVEAALLRDDYQWWPAEGAALLTDRVRYGQKMGVRFAHAGGDLEALRALFPRVEAWARGIGAVRLECWGRPGWGRQFPGTVRGPSIFYKEF